MDQISKAYTRSVIETLQWFGVCLDESQTIDERLFCAIQSAIISIEKTIRVVVFDTTLNHEHAHTWVGVDGHPYAVFEFPPSHDRSGAGQMQNDEEVNVFGTSNVETPPDHVLFVVCDLFRTDRRDEENQEMFAWMNERIRFHIKVLMREWVQFREQVPDAPRKSPMEVATDFFPFLFLFVGSDYLLSNKVTKNIYRTMEYAHSFIPDPYPTLEKVSMNRLDKVGSARLFDRWQRKYALLQGFSVSSRVTMSLEMRVDFSKMVFTPGSFSGENQQEEFARRKGIWSIWGDFYPAFSILMLNPIDIRLMELNVRDIENILSDLSRLPSAPQSASTPATAIKRLVPSEYDCYVMWFAWVSERARTRLASVDADGGMFESKYSLPHIRFSLSHDQYLHAEKMQSILERFGVVYDVSTTGSGKTYTSCYVASAMPTGPAKVIVFCPATVRAKWKSMCDLGIDVEAVCAYTDIQSVDQRVVDPDERFWEPILTHEKGALTKARQYLLDLYHRFIDDYLSCNESECSLYDTHDEVWNESVAPYLPRKVAFHHGAKGASTNHFLGRFFEIIAVCQNGCKKKRLSKNETPALLLVAKPALYRFMQTHNVVIIIDEWQNTRNTLTFANMCTSECSRAGRICNRKDKPCWTMALSATPGDKAEHTGNLASASAILPFEPSKQLVDMHAGELFPAYHLSSMESSSLARRTHPLSFMETNEAMYNSIRDSVLRLMFRHQTDQRENVAEKQNISIIFNSVTRVSGMRTVMSSDLHAAFGRFIAPRVTASMPGLPRSISDFVFFHEFRIQDAELIQRIHEALCVLYMVHIYRYVFFLLKVKKVGSKDRDTFLAVSRAMIPLHVHINKRRQSAQTDLEEIKRRFENAYASFSGLRGSLFSGRNVSRVVLSEPSVFDLDGSDGDEAPSYSSVPSTSRKRPSKKSETATKRQKVEKRETLGELLVCAQDPNLEAISSFSMHQLAKLRYAVFQNLELAKLGEMIEVVQERYPCEPHAKYILGLSFRVTIDEASRRLTELRIPFRVIDGTVQARGGHTSDENKQKIIDEFQREDNDIRVLVMNIDVANAGIDLDDKGSAPPLRPRVMLMSQNFKLINLVQMCGRVNRKSTRSDPTAFILYTSGIDPSGTWNRAYEECKPFFVTHEWTNELFTSESLKEQRNEDKSIEQVFLRLTREKSNILGSYLRAATTSTSQATRGNYVNENTGFSSLVAKTADEARLDKILEQEETEEGKKRGEDNDADDEDLGAAAVYLLEQLQSRDPRIIPINNAPVTDRRDAQAAPVGRRPRRMNKGWNNPENLFFATLLDEYLEHHNADCMEVFPNQALVGSETGSGPCLAVFSFAGRKIFMLDEETGFSVINPVTVAPLDSADREMIVVDQDGHELNPKDELMAFFASSPPSLEHAEFSVASQSLVVQMDSRGSGHTIIGVFSICQCEWMVTFVVPKSYRFSLTPFGRSAVLFQTGLTVEEKTLRVVRIDLEAVVAGLDRFGAWFQSNTIRVPVAGDVTRLLLLDSLYHWVTVINGTPWMFETAPDLMQSEWRSDLGFKETPDDVDRVKTQLRVEYTLPRLRFRKPNHVSSSSSSSSSSEDENSTVNVHDIRFSPDGLEVFFVSKVAETGAVILGVISCVDRRIVLSEIVKRGFVIENSTLCIYSVSALRAYMLWSETRIRKANGNVHDILWLSRLDRKSKKVAASLFDEREYPLEKPERIAVGAFDSMGSVVYTEKDFSVYHTKAERMFSMDPAISGFAPLPNIPTSSPKITKLYSERVARDVESEDSMRQSPLLQGMVRYIKKFMRFYPGLARFASAAPPLPSGEDLAWADTEPPLPSTEIVAQPNGGQLVWSRSERLKPARERDNLFFQFVEINENNADWWNLYFTLVGDYFNYRELDAKPIPIALRKSPESARIAQGVLNDFVTKKSDSRRMWVAFFSNNDFDFGDEAFLRRIGDVTPGPDETDLSDAGIDEKGMRAVEKFVFKYEEQLGANIENFGETMERVVALLRKIEMSVTISLTEGFPFVIHMGIFRNPLPYCQKGTIFKYGFKVDASRMPKGIGVALHVRAAQAIAESVFQSNTDGVYMVSKPSETMMKILLDALPDDTCSIGFRTREEDIEKIEMELHEDVFREHRIRPSPFLAEWNESEGMKRIWMKSDDREFLVWSSNSEEGVSDDAWSLFNSVFIGASLFTVEYDVLSRMDVAQPNGGQLVWARSERLKPARERDNLFFQFVEVNENNADWWNLFFTVAGDLFNYREIECNFIPIALRRATESARIAGGVLNGFLTQTPDSQRMWVAFFSIDDFDFGDENFLRRVQDVTPGPDETDLSDAGIDEKGMRAVENFVFKYEEQLGANIENFGETMERVVALLRKIEMSVTISLTEGFPFVIHMGIFRNPLRYCQKGTNDMFGFKVDNSRMPKGISVALHVRAAQAIAENVFQSNTDGVYMVSKPSDIMIKILLEALPDGACSIGVRTQEEDFEKNEMMLHEDVLKEHQIRPSPFFVEKNESGRMTRIWMKKGDQDILVWSSNKEESQSVAWKPFRSVWISSSLFTVEYDVLSRMDVS